MKLRSRQRGAALVEATVVIPVLLVFLGLIMYSSHSYAKKIDNQMYSRSGTMYYASNACDKAPPTGVGSPVTEDDSAAVGNPVGDDGQAAGSKLNSETQSAMSQTSRLVTTSNDATVYGKAIVDRRDSISTQYFNQNIHSYSTVACNEHVYDGFFGSLIGFAKDFYNSKGGLF